MAGSDRELIATLRALLEQALTLAPGERTAWLARLRAESGGVAAELERLLAEEGELDARGFLEGRGPAEFLLEDVPLAGRSIGAYTLERPVGQGGMGTVWLARRSDGRFEGRAAVKLLNLALLDAVGQERFRREGSALARLTHPNIARLIDAGVTPEGQPYLVLEYVEGSRLDQYCDEHRLAPAERIGLFQQVLAAVAHAHANLVVHRDLKPSNILVTPDGTVKLLDFGIAKLLADESGEGEATTLTEVGGHALTPEFAAPEQIAGERVTIATDVYALGVLLYLLLAGRHPTGHDARTAAEHLRGVLDTEPQPLSRAVGAPEARASSLERLRRLYAGDLDNIVAKALKKRPEERYVTVSAMADDLRRFLGHEPVSARPDSLRYRAGKFVRRNRVAVAAGAAVLLTLLAATAFSVRQLRETRRQRDAAVAESRRRLAMSDVQSVLAGDTRGRGGRTLSVRERIGLAEQVLRRKYRDEPWIVVDLMADLSNRLYDLGDIPGQGEVLERARQLARQADLPAELALTSCLRMLGLVEEERHDSARALLISARADLARAGRPNPDIEIRCLNAEGRLLAASGATDSAIVPFRRAVELSGDHGPLLLESLNGLAIGLRAAGRTREATIHQRRILLELDSTGYGDTDIRPAVLSYLTGALSELGEFRAVDSVTGVYVRHLESMPGEGGIDGRVAALYGQNKLRLGEFDSSATWLQVAAADTGLAVIEVASGWVPPAMTQLLIEQGRIAEARQAAAGLPLDSPVRRATAVLIGARIRRGQGDSAAAWTMLDSLLRAEITSPKPPVRLIWPLLAAAEWRLVDGHGREADSLARLAIAAAALDSLALTRSALVGRGELIRARAAAEARDSAAAREAAGRALVALTNGNGPANPITLQARAFRDSLTATARNGGPSTPPLR